MRRHNISNTTYILESSVVLALAGLADIVTVLVEAHQGGQAEVRQLQVRRRAAALWEV